MAMQHNQWARAVGGVIAVTVLVGVVGVAVHHDAKPSTLAASGQPSIQAPAGSTASTVPGAPADPSLPTTTVPAIAPAAPGGPTTTTTVLAPVAPAPTSAGSHPTTTVVATPPTGPPAPTRPGTYTFTHIKGSNNAARVLVISPPSGGVETWNDNANLYTTQVLFNGAGVYTQSLAAFGDTCTFSPPLASPPWPLTVGGTFSGRSTCQGPIAATVAVTGRVVTTQPVTLVDKTSVATFVVQTTINAGVGNSITAVVTDWYAPSLRLPVQTQVTFNGTTETYLLNSAPLS